MRLKNRLAAGTLLVFIVILFVFREPILLSAGTWLIRDEAPQTADIGCVLGGDTAGNRVLKGALLVRQGYIPRLYVSGEGSHYGEHESTLAIRFAMRHGEPAESFVPLLYPALSTKDEAEHLIMEFRRLGYHRILVVTGITHTARAGRVFRRLAPDLEFHTVAAEDPKWNHGRWWETREGRKLWLLESSKTIADYLGI